MFRNPEVTGDEQTGYLGKPTINMKKVVGIGFK